MGLKKGRTCRLNCHPKWLENSKFLSIFIADENALSPGRDVCDLDGLRHSLLLVLASFGCGGSLVLRLGRVHVLELLIVLK